MARARPSDVLAPSLINQCHQYLLIEPLLLSASTLSRPGREYRVPPERDLLLLNGMGHLAFASIAYPICAPRTSQILQTHLRQHQHVMVTVSQFSMNHANKASRSYS